MNYKPSGQRYDSMQYNRCGQSGLLLPAIALGLWHNFGDVDDFENSRNLLLRAFDLGITHFDLANNYGPPPGAAERTFGKILKSDLAAYRDELIISTKAGWEMWPGPYGNFGSRKQLIVSLDQSLKRMGLDYVDIFYHHRPDPDTPLEETIGALDYIVRSGRALYVGVSQYDARRTSEAVRILSDLGTPLLVHQPVYSMFRRWVEEGLGDVLLKEGVGATAFSPLAQGLLTDRYLNGIPADSRMAKPHGFLKKDQLTEATLDKIKKLNDLARQRGQTLSQMAIAWVLRLPAITSALVGASKVSQIENSVAALHNREFTEAELNAIDAVLAGES